MIFLFATNTVLVTAFLTYQFKVALILACFYVLYRLLMSKETFHKLNRCLLNGMLIVSFILPFCVITIHRYVPQNVIETIEPIERANTVSPPFTAIQDLQAVPDLKPEIRNTDVTASAATQPGPEEPVNLWTVAFVVWLAGAAFCIMRITVSVIQVIRLIKSGCEVFSDGNVHVYVLDKNISPFSWFNRIVISLDDFESANSSVIIDHEMTHARLGHSYDSLMVDILSAMQWFNPVTVMLRNDLKDVHEYQVDGCVLDDGFDAREYQYMLLGKVASMSGYSVTNHFIKQNLSDRIRMMNRKESKSSRALKALYAPLLAGIVIMSLAVTVYDCKPSKGSGRNVDVLRDSMQILDEIYGQGKFNRFPWERGAVWLTEGDTVIVRTGDGVEAVMKPREVADYLLDYKDFSTHRITIVLSKLDGDQTETGLNRARPLTDMLNEVGIRTLVVKSDAEWYEAYYSTYRYGRIYTLRKGVYELDHNGLIVRGTPKKLADWIKTLDIEYMAFFPDEIMPWSDASIMMKAAYERGSRTFSICVSDSDNSMSVPADKKAGGRLSRENKAAGHYRITILPVKRNLDKEFRGRTVMDVERRIRGEYTDDYIAKAKKVIDNPAVLNGKRVDKVIFCDKELVIIRKNEGFKRNNWVRPNAQDYQEQKIIADGKEYRFVREEGFHNFSDYPWRKEYDYANGSFFWAPENGYLYSAEVYEAVPEETNCFDIVAFVDRTGRTSYVSRGVNISEDRHLFDDVKAVRATSAMTLELPGTQGTSLATVQQIEMTPDSTEVFLHVLVRADFSYQAYVGSDIKLTLNDGTTLGLLSADVPLDEDFDRRGDHVLTTARLVYPRVELDKLCPDVQNGRYAKLSGTLFHRNFELAIVGITEKI